jgi:AcrR family transcriptional regulator
LNDDSLNETHVRKRLILAGIDDLSHNGVENFSVRRVAKKCQVSCSAPYKHFKDKREYFEAIIEYINKLWAERQNKVLQNAPDDVRKQLVIVSLEYVKFLVENPHFFSIIMIKNESFTTDYSIIKGKLSKCSQDLINKYCTMVGMPKQTEIFKTYIVRSLIYGAALMIGNGELENNEESFGLIAGAINREFDI